MRVLLVRPQSPNERFGLGPFFRVEPLGLEYVGAALMRDGHRVSLVDLRFGESLDTILRRFAPQVVGISSLHTVDTDASLETARAVKRHDPRIFTLIGGHAAATYPDSVTEAAVDAIALEDGEAVVPALVDALERGGDVRSIPGFVFPGGRSPASAERVSLDVVARPARSLVSRYQSRYMCVHKSPLWALETARGCPYRCSFCSIWRHHDRTYRLRDVDAVCDDFATVGGNVFVVDDLFWYPRPRSLDLAKALRERSIKKDWILVQSRLDTVARSPQLLEAYRPLAETFDIFFGFEAASTPQLDELDKDLTIEATEEGVAVARRLGFGVTGNFVVDPDWDEADFEAMWAMVDRLRLDRVGYTILTPLPGTPLFDRMRDRIREPNWARWDMHHVLWEPKLGRRRFFELFVQSWKRNVLSANHSGRRWLRWLRGLGPRQAALLAGVLWQTQRMLRVDAYLEETFLQVPAVLADPFPERSWPPLADRRPSQADGASPAHVDQRTRDGRARGRVNLPVLPKAAP